MEIDSQEINDHTHLVIQQVLVASSKQGILLGAETKQKLLVLDLAQT